jgi:chemotaxis protein MotB
VSDDTQQPIIVKRIKKVAGGHHGGAWKIAYADFMTAMMAFFLLMWLLGSTTKGDLKGIADYFNTPLKVAMAGGSGSGDSSSILQGGGEDLTRASGQVKRGDVAAPKRNINLQALKADFEKRERGQLETLKDGLEALIEASPNLKQFKNQMLLDLTTEGLRVQIVDEKNRPMFDSASSELKPYTREILRELGREMNKVGNPISLAGHTDAAPYAGGSGGFGNWELSTNRANASRRELVAGGMADAKILRVVGLASTVLFDKNDPYNPSNRRISIIVLNKRTVDAILNDGKGEDEAGNGTEDGTGVANETGADSPPAATGKPAAAPN